MANSPWTERVRQIGTRQILSPVCLETDRLMDLPSLLLPPRNIDMNAEHLIAIVAISMNPRHSPRALLSIYTDHLVTHYL